MQPAAPSPGPRTDRADCDVCSLPDISEESVLATLERRFQSGNSLTRAGGSVLIFVNPYERQLYESGTTADGGSDGSGGGGGEPSLKDISRCVYSFIEMSANTTGLIARTTVQSIIISGESGAGKTESLNELLSHLVYSAHESLHSPQKAIHASRVLEVFGNSSTSRNHNSSRYGKLTRLVLSPQCGISSIDTQIFLLEKTRVSGRSNKEEHNFHAFYSLFAAGATSVRCHQHFKGKNPWDFKYLRSSTHEQEVQNHKSVEELITSLKLGLDFTELEVEDVFSFVAGILHMGQLSHSADSPAEQTSAGDEWTCVGDLLGVSPLLLQERLTKKVLVVNQQSITVPLSGRQCDSARDSCANELYSAMFQLLVLRANQSFNRFGALSPRPEQPAGDHVVNVLDMFGFENMVHNGLEQLLINYANERLHDLFVQQNVLQLREEYLHEGIDVPDVYVGDVTAVSLARMMDSRHGLFDVLHQATVLANRNSEQAKHSSLDADLTKLSGVGERRLLTVSKFPHRFSLTHFASDVEYSTEGMVERNRNGSLCFLPELASQSTNSVFRAAFEAKPGSAGGLILSDSSAGSTKATSSLQGLGSVCRSFSEQVRELLSSIHHSPESGVGASTRRLYHVKCFKSNNQQAPGSFDMDAVRKQLRCSGLVPAATIARAQFQFQVSLDALRSLFAALLVRYRCSGAEELLQAFRIPNSSAAVGRSRLYLSGNAWEMLTQLNRRVASSSAVQLQLQFRKWQRRQHSLRAQSALQSLQIAAKTVLGFLRTARDRSLFLKKKRLVRAIERLWIMRTAIAVRSSPFSLHWHDSETSAWVVTCGGGASPCSSRSTPHESCHGSKAADFLTELDGIQLRQAAQHCRSFKIQTWWLRMFHGNDPRELFAADTLLYTLLLGVLCLFL